MGGNKKGAVSRAVSGAEKAMDKVATHAGAFFPVTMLMAAIFTGGAVWWSGENYQTTLIPLIPYGIGFMGVCMKVVAVLIRSGIGRKARPTLLTLGFTYERVALLVLLISVIIIRIQIAKPHLVPFDIPTWFTYSLIGASMSAMFMVGWLELLGGGKRQWLGRHVEAWPFTYITFVRGSDHGESLSPENTGERGQQWRQGEAGRREREPRA